MARHYKIVLLSLICFIFLSACSANPDTGTEVAPVPMENTGSDSKPSEAGEQEIEIYEDYVYIFIENMLGRICNIPSLKMDFLLGEIGKWQEYYYDTAYIEKHADEIEFMSKALFLSGEKYGIFLYEYKGDIWLELNRGFSELSGLTPYDYYCNPDYYRVSLNKVSEKKIGEWKNTLEQYMNHSQVSRHIFL